VPYYHVVFTLPAPIADIAWQNKAVVYGILFKAAAEALITIAAEPADRLPRPSVRFAARSEASRCPDRVGRRAAHLGLGADPFTHTSTSSCPAAASRRMGSAGSRAGPDSSCRSASSRGCSAGCSWKQLAAAYLAGQLQSSVVRPHWQTPRRSSGYLAPLRKPEWVVYAKRPFGGPQAVLAYLSRYTHRVAIGKQPSHRVQRFRGHFQMEGLPRQPATTREGDDTRHRRVSYGRFLIHVLPSGFHRIRHYGLFANGGRAENIAQPVSCSVFRRCDRNPATPPPRMTANPTIRVSLSMLRRPK